MERLRRNTQLRRLNEVKHIHITDEMLKNIAKKHPNRDRLRTVTESLSVPLWSIRAYTVDLLHNVWIEESKNEKFYNESENEITSNKRISKSVSLNLSPRKL